MALLTPYSLAESTIAISLIPENVLSMEYVKHTPHHSVLGGMRHSLNLSSEFNNVPIKLDTGFCYVVCAF